jgi:L-seryl-tRNA(Ser) seleniumtransferase
MVGAGDVITAVKSHPLARAMRADAVTYAALAATLEVYLEGSVDEIPFWRYALLEETDLETRCHALADAVGGVVEPGDSKVGAGSAPRISIPTLLVRLESRQDLYECLLSLDRPILTRRAAGDLIVDLRAVDPGDDAVVAAGIDKCR